MREAPEAPAASSIENLPQLPGSGPEAPEVPELPDVPDVPENPLINTGERTQVGSNRGWGGLFGAGKYEAAFYKQVMVGQEVYPGDPVGVRLQAEGVNGDTRVRELRDIMPSSFELVSVARVTVGEEGENPTILEEGQYEVVEREDGFREIRVPFGTNDFDRPTLAPGQTLTVDILYRAPQEVGVYEHGGYARTVQWGGGGAAELGGQTGGQPIEVKERPIVPEPPGDESGDGIWGSIDWGSFDLGALFGSASGNDEPAEEPVDEGDATADPAE